MAHTRNGARPSPFSKGHVVYSRVVGWTEQAESIFPSTPIDTLLKDVIDWDQIHVNIANGYVDAMSISCTQVQLR